MVFRAILLSAFAALVLAEADIARAYDASKLLPRKASVVVPLLKEIKLGDSLSKVQKILGQGLSPTVDGAGQVQWCCMLDDGSLVTVGDTHHTVSSLTVIDAEGKVLDSASQATAPDSIDKAIADFCSDPEWDNGAFPSIDLPETAPTEQVVLEVLKMSGYRKKLAGFKILEVKKPHLNGGFGGPYTAALVKTDIGEMVVIIRVVGKADWWSRVIPVAPPAATQKSLN